MNFGIPGIPAPRRKLLSAVGLGPRYHVVLLRADGAVLGKIGALLGEGKLKVFLDRVLPLERARCGSCGRCRGPAG